MILIWVLNPRIFSRNWASNPLMTLMTMISTATPSVTPSTEIKVITETNVLLGRRYRSASSSSNGNPDMRPKLDAGRAVSTNRGIAQTANFAFSILLLHSLLGGVVGALWEPCRRFRVALRSHWG